MIQIHDLPFAMILVGLFTVLFILLDAVVNKHD